MSINIRPVNKVIVVSDLHLGEEECLLFKKNAKLLKSFKDKLEKEANKGKVDELIIIGDLFDLSLASFKDAYNKGKEFFKEIGQIGNLDTIVYVPGNHDHHIWSLIIEEEQIVKNIRKGKSPEEPLKRVDEEYNDTFLNELLKETGKKFLVSYPNLFRKIGEKNYLFHHGHLMDRIFTPVETILPARDIGELESFNTFWLESLWYHTGQAGRLSSIVEWGYEEIQDIKKNVEELLKKAGKTIKGILKGKEAGELNRQITNYIKFCVLTKDKIPDNFVFGHTHRKETGYPLDIEFNINGEKVERKINICNTGGWHGDSNKDHTCFIVIDSNGAQLCKI